MLSLLPDPSDYEWLAAPTIQRFKIFGNELPVLTSEKMPENSFALIGASDAGGKMGEDNRPKRTDKKPE